MFLRCKDLLKYIHNHIDPHLWTASKFPGNGALAVQKTVNMTLPMDRTILNFCSVSSMFIFHNVLCCFISDVQKWIHISSWVTILSRNSLNSANYLVRNFNAYTIHALQLSSVNLRWTHQAQFFLICRRSAFVVQIVLWLASCRKHAAICVCILLMVYWQSSLRNAQTHPTISFIVSLSLPAWSLLSTLAHPTTNLFCNHLMVWRDSTLFSPYTAPGECQLLHTFQWWEIYKTYPTISTDQNCQNVYTCVTWSTKRVPTCEKKFSEIRDDKDTRKVLSVWR